MFQTSSDRFKSFISLLLFILSLGAHAQVAQTKAISIVQAEKKLQQMQKNIEANSQDFEQINNSIKQLKQQIDKANDCSQSKDKQIDTLDIQIRQYFGNVKKSAENVDALYLEKQKQALVKQRAACRLLKIRGEELLGEYQNEFIALQQKITFTRDKDILKRLSFLVQNLNALALPTLAVPASLSQMAMILYPLTLLALSFFINWRLRWLLHKRFRNSALHYCKNSILQSLVLIFSFYYFFVAAPFASDTDNMLYEAILVNFIYYSLSIYGIVLLFSCRRVSEFIHWHELNASFIKVLVLSIIHLYFIRAIGLELLALFQSPGSLIQLFEDTMLFLCLTALLCFSYYFYNKHPHLLKKNKQLKLVYQVIIVLSLFLLVLDFSGYAVLAINLAHFSFSLILLSVLGLILFSTLNRIYYSLNYNTDSRWYLKKTLGYNSEPPFFEFIILKFIVQAVIVISLIYLFAWFIDELYIYINYVLDYIYYGFPIAAYTIIPIQWITGLFVFCIFSLLARFIATKIGRAQQFDGEEETQVALASITLYAGFSIAVFMALVLAGFGFTNLTIIVGALSVGIGLGLQSIVNNFFSGLILLIEKPIKAGDRIKIDGVEGFVKKVRIRSTQIQTPTQEDIIVPNSDLITHQVTNYMYSDKNWRVQVEVGVAYGSDTDLVRKLLLEIALAHPDVLKGRNKKPMVLFKSFGDSALIFNLWCLIKDVNQKFIVSSELHFAIDKAFRENNISIAFPQRDIHLSIEQGTLPPLKKE